MSEAHISGIQLLAAYAFVAIAMVLTLLQNLKLERELLIGTIRATVQLLLVGYILQFVFSMQSWPYTLLMIILIIWVAAVNVAGQGRGLPRLLPNAALALTVTEVIAMGLLLALRIVDATPQYVVLVSGMIIGSAMVASGLLVDRLRAEVAARRQEILVALSLGATSAQAAALFLRQSVRAASIPVLDNLKTIGLVQLPGLMSGMIIAGANPLQAVRYQLMLMFVLTADTILSTIILGCLTYPAFFTAAHQLRSDVR